MTNFETIKADTTAFIKKLEALIAQEPAATHADVITAGLTVLAAERMALSKMPMLMAITMVMRLIGTAYGVNKVTVSNAMPISTLPKSVLH